MIFTADVLDRTIHDLAERVAARASKWSSTSSVGLPFESLAKAAGITAADAAVALFESYYPHDALKPAARAWLDTFFG